MPGQNQNERVEKARLRTQILSGVHRRALQTSEEMPNMPTSVRSDRRRPARPG